MEPSAFAEKLKRLSRMLAVTASALGAGIAIVRFAFLGYASAPQFPHFAAGISFALCGGGIYLQHRGSRRSELPVRALVAAALGLTVFAIVFQLALGPPPAAFRYALMPPSTAVALLLLALAAGLMRSDEKNLLTAQIFAVASLAVSVLAVVGHVFGEIMLARVGQSLPMTAAAALMVGILSLSILFSRPEAGIVQILVSPTAGGEMARRMLSPAIGIPVLLAWLTYQWRQDNLVSDAFGLAVVAVGTVILFSGLMWSQALTLDRYDRARLHNRQELSRIEENVRLLVDTVRDYAIFSLDADRRIVSWNTGARQLFGYRPEEIVGRPFDTLFAQEDSAAHRPAGMLDAARTHGRATFERPGVRRDGSRLDIYISISALQESSQLSGYVSVIQDISERKAVEDHLQRSKQDLEIALEGANVHLWHLDWPAKTMTFMDGLPRMLGYALGEVRPDLDFWLALIHPDDRACVEQAAQRAAAGTQRPIEAEIRLHAKDGRWIWTFIRARAVERDAADRPLRIAGTCLDITERKQAEEKMLHIAQHDTLTGLPNRALAYAFGERVLASARRDGQQSAVLFIDLDRFKPINDTYGHDAGDAVLRETAARLSGCTRAEDVVGRLGGDEFLIVLADVDGLRGAGRVAAQCISALGKPYRYKEVKLQVSSSIGISLFPSDGGDIFTLVNRADTAMYHAKECGRDNFQFFTEELNARATSALQMENRLRGGLRRGEFRLHYQPIVALGSGRVIGAEALLRWPDAGVPPEQFVAVAEYSGLIGPLGEWALNEACRQQRAWQAKGMAAIKISVNVSPAQFRQPGFRGIVAKAVVDSGIEPGLLQLEITENVLLKNPESVIDALQALRRLGLRVVLDDFGKGYSSLSYLKQLPVDAIKIDRDFIHDLHVDPANMAITAAIIKLGRDLGLQVIAEGIESEATFRSLQQRQCEAIQGFYVGRPMPGAEFENWYRRRDALLH